MTKFEYDITLYPASAFSELVYFCSNEGECTADEIPRDQTLKLKEILNDRGEAGWELVHLAFARLGLTAFWKRLREQ